MTDVAFYVRSYNVDEANCSVEDQKTSLSLYLDQFSAQEGVNYSSVIFIDQEVDSKSYKTTELKRLLRRAVQGSFDLVITLNLDRFSRNKHDILKFIHELQEANVSLLSVEEGFDSRSPVGQGMVRMLEKVVQLERHQISDHVKTKLGQMIKQRPVGGKTPFGYVYINRGSQDRFFVPHNSEYSREYNFPYLLVGNEGQIIWSGEVVRKMFDWFLVERSYKAIVDRLREQAIPTPKQVYETLKLYQLDDGPKGLTPEYLRTTVTPGKWGLTTVRKILNNPFYMGTLVYNKFSNRMQSFRDPSEHLELPDHHPALVTPEVFEHCQGIIKQISRPRKE